MEPTIFPRAFAVDWEDLLRWNVSFFKVGLWDWPADMIRPLSDFAQLESVPIEARQAEAQELPIIAKINFGGELFLRPPEDYRKYKGKLFLVGPDRFIFSKINARQGCIFHADEAQPPFVVSSEYPVLRLDGALALGDYVDLALRVGPAREQLQGGAVGMAKPRTSAEDFLRIQIPLPPLWVQREIVARQRKVEADERAMREELALRETQADAQFLEWLGVPPHLKVERPRLLIMEWKDLERWAFDNAFGVAFKLNQEKSSHYSFVMLGDVAAVSYGIQKTPANRPQQHPRPYLRVANVRRGYLDLEEIKEINVPDKELKNYLLEIGDILFVEGNGSRAELGRVGMWQGEIENCVHQNHLIKVRAEKEKLLPEFAMTWFNSEVGRSHFFRAAKTSSGLGTINSSEVRSAPIPLPPLHVQREIMERVRVALAELAHLRETGETRAARGRAEIEALILGAQKL